MGSGPTPEPPEMITTGYMPSVSSDGMAGGFLPNPIGINEAIESTSWTLQNGAEPRFSMFTAPYFDRVYVPINIDPTGPPVLPTGYTFSYRASLYLWNQQLRRWDLLQTGKHSQGSNTGGEIQLREVFNLSTPVQGVFCFLAQVEATGIDTDLYWSNFSLYSWYEALVNLREPFADLMKTSGTISLADIDDYPQNIEFSDITPLGNYQGGPLLVLAQTSA